MLATSARKVLLLATLTALALAGRLSFAAPAAAPKTDTPATQPADAYPLTTCPVTDAKLGAMGKPVVYQHEGREVRFCCGGCPAVFKKDPAKYLAKMDAQIVKQETPNYPLDTCVVSGDKLGDMGGAVDYVYNNRLVRLCCKSCIDTFKKDPAKYLKQLDAAKAAKAATQPATQPAAPAHGAHGDAGAPSAAGDAACGGCCGN